MKFAILCTLLLLTTVQAHCQNNSEKLLYLRKSQSSAKARNTGATLTVLGVISLITGSVIANNTPPYAGPGKAPSGFNDKSKIWIAGGVVCLGIGIPLWIGGAVNEKRYDAKLESLFVRLDTNTRGRGLTLTYRF